MGWSEDELQGRIEEVIVDAYGDDEQLESFACVLGELLERPLPATVIGAPVHDERVRRVIERHYRERVDDVLFRFALIDA